MLYRLVGLLAIVPATVLLTISFFVLFSIRKAETQGLKAFGYVVAALLWISALAIFSLGIYTVATGRHPMMCTMQEMMKTKMHMMKPTGMMPSMMPAQK